MRLDHVEVCGFRGFRDRLRVDFGAGFTVISGRNGVGKSTLCDAVEFALTGGIGKYAVEKAAKESLNDYLWWRGEGAPAAHYVKAAFIGEDGANFVVTRTRASGADKSHEEIESALCRGTKPDNALLELCKTSIIRDEWIAALSLDLSDTARFDLVRSALGSTEGADFAARAAGVASKVQAFHARDADRYGRAREALSTALAELSEAKEAAARAGDVALAFRIIDRLAAGMPDALDAKLRRAREILTTRRAALAGAANALGETREIVELRRVFEERSAVGRRAAARERYEKARAAKIEADSTLATAERAYAIEEKADALASSLSLLVEHGERIGLHDDKCPLCAAARNSEEFTKGLALAKERVETLSSGVAAAAEKLRVSRGAAESAGAAFAQAEADLKADEEEEKRIQAREEAQIEIFERLGLDFRLAKDPDGLEHELAAERERLIELERAILSVESSQSAARIASLEDRVAALRHDVETAARAAARSEAALDAAKSIEREIKRVSGEVIDERLAEISPLLNELYQRLRPHADWRTIEYSVRGDVRRFLSLKVGEGLNPQFVFSSGQRRAAGLAFLLSVSLARSWARWQTLILDDPIQHIDDFRALHLVEVLAAIRLEGRQIVCAVEDPALADLLCRRLVSVPDGAGVRYDIDLAAEGAVEIAARVEIPPTPTGILHSAVAQSAS